MKNSKSIPPHWSEEHTVELAAAAGKDTTAGNITTELKVLRGQLNELFDKIQPGYSLENRLVCRLAMELIRKIHKLKSETKNKA